MGCCVATFTVGGLSLINAIAGAYAEDLPVICLIGGPNSNDFGKHACQDWVHTYDYTI